MEHTKGPWKQRSDDSVCVVDANGNAICYTDTFLPHDQCIANARLVSSAPEFLEVAKAMVADDAFAELCQGIGEEPIWLKNARAAIAKA